MSHQEKEEIGGYICSTCKDAQLSLMSQSGSKSYKVHLKKQKIKDVFGKSINSNIDFLYSPLSEPSKRELKPSIIQEQPDAVEMGLFIDIVEEKSCFVCGVFLPIR